MRIYLDNCCYNRPYDDQSQLRISLESQAKLHIQKMVRDGQVELVTSFVLDYENSKNRSEEKKASILQFMKNYSFKHIDSELLDEVRKIAKEIMSTGVNQADAAHTACAILADCDYMLTTDDRLLKYKSEKVRIINPTQFIMILGGIEYD